VGLLETHLLYISANRLACYSLILFVLVSYEIPAGMQFFGIIASKQLFQGQKFGPFPGNIAQTVDPSVLNYSFISQVRGGGGGRGPSTKLWGKA
jgi:hypothetical protein